MIWIDKSERISLPPCVGRTLHCQRTIFVEESFQCFMYRYEWEGMSSIMSSFNDTMIMMCYNTLGVITEKESFTVHTESCVHAACIMMAFITRQGVNFRNIKSFIVM